MKLFANKRAILLLIVFALSACGAPTATTSSTPSSVSTATHVATTPTEIVGASPSATVGASPSATVGASPSATVGASPSATVGASATLTPEPRPFAIIGYLPDYRELKMEWGDDLTDIIYFSAEPRADGTLDTSRLNEKTLSDLLEMKRTRGVKIHVSIGGWERSKEFAPMSANPATRQKFISALVEFALGHNLDGVDYDWEFPENDTELSNYIALLRDTQQALARHGMIVSVALSPDFASSLESFAFVDRIHIMSYDRGPRHATFDQAVMDLQTFMDAGIPREKLILGIPFYGRNVEPPYKVLGYAEIVQRYDPAPSVNEVDGIFFNGIDLVVQKTCLAARGGIGGVMVWELSHDTVSINSLLKVIARTVRGGLCGK